MRCVLVAIGLCGCGVTTPTKEQVGQLLFEDKNLSSPAGTACSSCHDPKQAFREPESDFATSAGAVKGRFGPRNTQTAMYARYVPPLQYDEARGEWIGGLFHDGRASTLEEQAEKPLLNPLEMNNANKAAVVETVRKARYAASFTAVFGPHALDDADAGYANLGIPKYLNNPFFANEPAMNPEGAAYIDHGLMETVADPAQDGKFRIPTLRNVARTPPYGHAGYFENLPYVLEFIATRDGYSQDGAWPGPEVAATVDQRVGHLPLTNADLDDLRAFLVTLNDP